MLLAQLNALHKAWTSLKVTHCELFTEQTFGTGCTKT